MIKILQAAQKGRAVFVEMVDAPRGRRALAEAEGREQHREMVKNWKKVDGTLFRKNVSQNGVKNDRKFHAGE